MTAIATAAALGEHLGVIGWVGIAALAAGVLLLSLRGSRDLQRLDRRAIGFALLTAVTICTYTVVDGIGARRAGSAHAYTAAMFFGIGISMAVYAAIRRGTPVLATMARHWPMGLAGGAMQFTSYGIAIWAMTVAPIALVGALRETSVLFGTILAVVFLKEPVLMPRVVAASMIVCRARADPPELTSPWRELVQHTETTQARQILRHIHVPQRRRLLPREPVIAQPSACLRHHLVRAPTHAGEQRGQGLAQPDQHIAPVFGGQDDGIAAAAQHLGGHAQMRGHHGGTICAEYQGRAVCRPQRGEHARAEVAVRLACERDVKARGQRLEYDMGLVRRRPHRHRPDTGGAGGVDRAFDQARLQPRGAAVPPAPARVASWRSLRSAPSPALRS